MEKNNRQKEKGITLIVLVVTIVVILILAGITMDLAFDKNGIIKRAMGLQEIVNQSVANEEKELDSLLNQLDSTLANLGIDQNTTTNESGGGEEDTTKPGILPIDPRDPESIKKGETSTEIVVIPTEKPVSIDPTKFKPVDESGNPITDPNTKVNVTQDPEGNIHITITGGDIEGPINVEIQPGGLKDPAGNENDKIKIDTNITVDNTKPGILPIEPRDPETIQKEETSTEIVVVPTEKPVSIDPSKFKPIDESGKPITDPNTKVNVTQDEDGNIHITITGGDAIGTVDIEIQPGGIKDLAENENDKITIDTNITVEEGDRIAPTIKSVTTTGGRADGFTVSIDAEDNEGGVGLAEEDTYTIYYRRKGNSTYQSITTSNNVYQFTGLTPVEANETNPPKLREGMNPVIWIDLNGNGTIEEETEEITKYTDLAAGTINPVWTENNGDSKWSYYNDPNGMYEIYVTAKDKNGNISDNSPNIQEKINSTDKLDHKTSHWGNVKMEEDGSYFVWVPRYAYKITPAPSTLPSETNAGTIDVKFIKGTGNTAYDGTTCTIATSNPDKTPNNIDSTTQYIVHPAFCEDVNMGGYATNLEGIWVAKYESSREDSTDGTNWITIETTEESIGNIFTTKAGNISSTKKRVVSKPNVTSWKNIYIKNCYINAYNYNRSLDSHLMKNSEWGAVAYLTHSQYGRNGNEIAVNDSFGNYTGRSAGMPVIFEYSVEGTYQYNVTEGMLASTSGNIYGIYDLNGGADEFMAAWDTESKYTEYGSSFASEKGESTKYATAYHNGTDDYYSTSEKCILGDATYEVNIDPGNLKDAWFSDYSVCANNRVPFFERGGQFDKDPTYRSFLY